MLTPRQNQLLRQRDPDLRVCAHVAAFHRVPTSDGVDVCLIRIDGHIVLSEDDDHTAPVPDHRLISFETGIDMVTFNRLARIVNSPVPDPMELMTYRHAPNPGIISMIFHKIFGYRKGDRNDRP